MSGRFAASTLSLLLTVATAANGQATKPPSQSTADHSMAGMPGMGSHESAELAFLFPDGDDKGWSKVENGMQHNMAPDVPLVKLEPAVRTELLRQLSLTLDVVKKYPTVKDAEAAGYRRAGPFLPGLGTHYVGGKTNQSGTLTDDDILHPATIIYAGNAPDSPIAGFMYISISMRPGGNEPEGFAGPNDHWHYHTGICLTNGTGGVMEALGFDGSITAESCKAKGGNYKAVTQYQLHVWTVPGYTDPLGVFAHTNPALTCDDGTYYMDTHDVTNACKVP